MTPIARQELRHFAETVRARREREREPKPDWTAADYGDAVVAAVVMIAAIAFAVIGL